MTYWKREPGEVRGGWTLAHGVETGQDVRFVGVD